MGLGFDRSMPALGVAIGCAVAASFAPPVTAAESGSAPPSSFVGTWSDNMSIVTTAGQGRAASQARLDDVASAGVGLVRQYVWWDRIETSPGVYDWTTLDTVVGDAAARGIAVLPTLLYPPGFHSSKPAGSTSTRIFPPSDPQTMADFATAMVKRYGPFGTYWNCARNPPVIGELQCPAPYLPLSMYEVWNEPDYPSWWRTPGPNPAEYLALLEPVHAAIKAADPTATVVLGSLTNAGAGTEGGFLDRLYELGAADHFDVLAINAYARDVGSMMAFIHGARSIATEHVDGDVPIMVTEYGWASAGTHSYVTTSEGCQAALLHTATSELIRRRDELGLAGIIQFQWHDVPVVGGAWPHYTGVRRGDGTAKPSRAAFAEAIAGRSAPAGATLSECPADRQALDGQLQWLHTDVTGSGAGTVTSSPSGISCGTDCEHQLQPGQVVTLTAAPAPGSRVVAWHGADCSPTATTCVLTMSADRDVSVELSAAAPVGAHSESDPAVAYTGTWRKVRDARDRGGASRVAGSRPASAMLRFRGQGVRWISRLTRTSGRNAVFIDGVRVRVVDRYSAVPRYQRRVFDSGVLPRGEHTIRIAHTGTRNRRAIDDNVWLDAFVVY